MIDAAKQTYTCGKHDWLTPVLWHWGPTEWGGSTREISRPLCPTCAQPGKPKAIR